MTAALQDIKAIEIEEWKTLNTAASPTKLEKGQTPNAKNVWVDEKPGSVITANGFLKVGTVPSNNPPTFCIDYFKSSTGSQTFIVSDNQTVWTTVDFQNFTSIVTGLSSSFQLRGKVIRDKLWLTNGSDSVRIFDGTTVTVLDGTGGTPNVPKGRFIEYHDERVWLFHTSSDRSGGFFSALTDSSGTIIDPDNASAWPSANEVQVSQGDADFGTGMIIFRGYLYFFKQYSIWRLIGYDEYTYSRVKTRASTGTRFNESLGELDGLVHLIGTDGLYVFDGESAERISDIIDPATASQTAFGFNQLQQPNTNNAFWETVATADWNSGTVSRNLTVDDSLELAATDDSQADFNAGTLTNVDADTNPGNLQLALVSSGGSSLNISEGKSGTLESSVSSRIGSDSFITDGNLVNNVGYSNGGDHQVMEWVVDLAGTFAVGAVTIKGFYFERKDAAVFADYAKIQAFVSGVWTDVATVSLPSATLQSGTFIFVTSPAYKTAVTDIPLSFNTVIATKVKFTMQANKGNYVITELQVFQAGFKPTGNFISRTLDLGAAPASLGVLNASYSLNGGTATFYTQTSADGASWDARVAVSPGASIASTSRRYLRWQVDFTYGSSGVTSPIIDNVYLMGQFISPIHNTGGSIFAWGPLEAPTNYFAQTVNFYYRTATTSGGVPGATWNLIVPGGVLNDSVSNVYVQFKIEVLSGDSTHKPLVESVTINWTVGTGTQPQVSQNVASAVWRNRYWLSAAGPSATENDTIVIRGKKTFGSPFQIKDWPIASFTRFQNNLYGGSSVDGSIYRLDTTYAKNGASMDSFFETGDFLFGGFYVNLTEILIEVERTGPYSLSVGVSTDRGLTYTDKTVDLTEGSSDSYVKRLNFDILTDRFRLRVRINDADRPFQVHRLYALYYLMTSRGSLN